MRRAACAAGCGLVLSLAAGSCSGPQSTGPRQATRPSFVVVMVDDQAAEAFRRREQPRTWRFFVDRGTRFENGFAVPALCCPSRAGFQTGQYPHNNGVFSDHPGWPELRHPRSVISTWLARAGYRTGFVGKYMNGYTTARPAPGYRYWWGVTSSRPGFFDYRISANGRPVAFSSNGGAENASQYSTNEFTRHALAFLSAAESGDRPFFLWLSYFAPHSKDDGAVGPCGNHRSTIPAPGDFHAVRHARVPQPPDFDRAGKQVGTTPRSAPPLSTGAIRTLTHRYRCQLGAMRDVDRGVGKIIRNLRTSGALQSTAVFYMSDNGFFFGQRRKDGGKGQPYDDDLRVPMLARIPPRLIGTSPPRRVTADVANIDIAPTMLDLSGARPCLGGSCRAADGTSLVPLLRGARRWDQNRGLLIERGSQRCTTRAIRTSGHLYAERRRWSGKRCTTISRELYDLRQDPYELDDELVPPVSRRVRATQRRLRRRLAALSECAGTSGRSSCLP